MLAEPLSRRTYSASDLGMRCVPIALLFSLGCASLQHAKPEREIVLIGVSSVRNLELAKDTARGRVLDRASQILSPTGIAFALDRSRGKPMLKIMSQGVPSGLTAEIEPRKPQGARATVKIARSDNDLADLRALDVVSVSADASGLDLAIAQERADRALFREAILRFASAKGLNDPKLYGRLRVVGYRAKDAGENVHVDAEISVAFSTDAEVRGEAKKSYVNEELEEVEPPEEKVDDRDSR
jgi:hypothetical protein